MSHELEQLKAEVSEMKSELARTKARSTKRKKKAIRWTIAIVALIISYLLAGMIFSILFSGDTIEKYTGLFGLAIGIIIMLVILNTGDEDETEVS